VAQPIAPDVDIASCGLSCDELQELWLGPSPQNGSLFDSEAELRAAWERGRDVVMRLWAHSGRRPQIWWHIEAPALGLAWPGYDRQQRYLYEAGILPEAEALELMQTWQRDFDRGQKVDLPPALRRQWTKTKRRQQTTEPRGEVTTAGLDSA
jgi:hypothetical protein